MQITIDEIKLIMNSELSIRYVLERKQEYIEQLQIELKDIDEKIKAYIQRHKVEVIFDNSINHEYEGLLINQNEFCFNEVKINCNDIMQIDLSMCSSKGCDGKAYFFLNYYVDLDIHTTSDTYSFQIMNNSQINNLFNYIVSLSVPINDPLGLIRIYRDRNDPVMLNKYLNKHFSSWSQEYNLDNPRENYISIMKESYIYPLKELKDNEHSIDKLVNEQFKALKTPYTEIFKRASKSINKCFAKLIKRGDCKDD